MIKSRALPLGTDLLALHRAAPERYPVLLESAGAAEPAQAHARWDWLLVADARRLLSNADGQLTDDGVPLDGTFLSALDARWREARVPRVDSPLPFCGGWAVLLGYEAAQQIEPVLRLPRAPGRIPTAVALRCPAAILRDRASGQCVAVCEADHEALLLQVLDDLAALAGTPRPLMPWQPPDTIAEDPPQRYLDDVRRVLDYIAAGDVFQVNLSRGWHADFGEAIDPAALHARLRAANPAPFAGLFSGDGWAVASASPERLVSVRDGIMQTRPIAGTRPRLPGDDDAARIRELVEHAKERAEHIMLIDLERNDLGRICVPGSVEVDELMTVETYSHVHHIVSNVRGRLRVEATPGDVLRAVFPGGTITGCPKVRCMQIIAELEGVGRGTYTGAMGWLGRDGDMDFNILIRSAEIEGRRLRFRAGAGIVADSDPQRELDETRAKARGMLRALGVSG